MSSPLGLHSKSSLSQVRLAIKRQKLTVKFFQQQLYNFSTSLFLVRHHHIIDGESSSETAVLSGVPQGTVLGPLLFLVHINDLPDCVKSSVRLFADDCLLYREIKSRDDQEILQNDLKNLEIPDVLKNLKILLEM